MKDSNDKAAPTGFKTAEEYLESINLWEDDERHEDCSLTWDSVVAHMEHYNSESALSKELQEAKQLAKLRADDLFNMEAERNGLKEELQDVSWGLTNCLKERNEARKQLQETRAALREINNHLGLKAEAGYALSVNEINRLKDERDKLIEALTSIGASSTLTHIRSVAAAALASSTSKEAKA